MAVGLYGYAAGQLMFCLSRTAAAIIIARLVAGFFTSNFVVSEILYLMRHSEPGEQGRNLAAAATVMFSGAEAYRSRAMTKDPKVMFQLRCPAAAAAA